MEDFEKYRRELAQTLKETPKEERREALVQAREAEDYQKAKEAKEAEAILDSSMDRQLAEQAPVNAGNNGLIYKLNFSGNPKLAHAVEERMQFPVSADSEKALKVLKVYNKGDGAEEARLQVKSHHAVEAYAAAHPDKPIARIPFASSAHNLPLKEKTLQELNRHGAFLHQPTAEVFLMDFIPGDDFAHIAYAEVIRRTPREVLQKELGMQPGEIMDEFIKGFSFRQLQDTTWRLLKLQNPEAKAENGAIKENRKVLIQNSRKIFGYLAKNGFVVHPSLAEQLENALMALNKEGIVHNDLHERNIMITGDPSSADAQVHIIDFGSARDKSFQVDDTSDDYSLVKVLKEMTLTKDERLVLEQSQEIRELAEMIERFSSGAKAHTAADRLGKLFPDAWMDGAAIVSRASGNELYETLAGLQILIERDVIQEDDVLQLLDEALNIIKDVEGEQNKRKIKKVSYKPLERRILTQVKNIFRRE